MRFLALDISGSTIGWSIFDEFGSEINLFKYGHIKPMSKKKASGLLHVRLNDAYIRMSDIINEFTPEKLIVEDYALKFSAGKSSANTIKVLSVFNEVIRLCAYQTGIKEIEAINVNTARKLIKNEYSFEILEKSDSIPFSEKFFNYKVTKNRQDNTKSECQDECDSIVIGVAYFISNKDK